MIDDATEPYVPYIPPRLRRTNANDVAEELFASSEPGTRWRASELYEGYLHWVTQRGLEPVSRYHWEKALAAAGLHPRTIDGRRYWIKAPRMRLVSLAEDIARRS